MTNISSPGGFLCCLILFVCSCVHFRRVKALKHILEIAKDKGPLSIFQKAAVIGVRFQYQIGFFAIVLAIVILVK
jgi:hypothetical protein